MKSEYLNIAKVFDLKKWQKLQDSLAAVTKMAIITVDYKGIPVTSHSGCREFCKSVREDENLARYCEKCDSRGGLEAVRINKPYIYLCHYHIVDVAIPIMIDDKYIGAIMAGQVKLPQNINPINNTVDSATESTHYDDHPLEQILTTTGKTLFHTKSDAASLLYNQLPILSYEEISHTADMLFQLSNYMVEEALDKNLIQEMYLKQLQPGNSSIETPTLTGYSSKNIQDVKIEMSNSLLNNYIKQSSKTDHQPVNPLLKAAFSYIYLHKSEKISQKKMAQLCHTSTSYFSKIFSKETGESFPNYLARLKIEWAKQLLETTDMPISQIGDELGFAESGYFIKTFKKYEGVTPAYYRKYYKPF